MTTPNLHYPLGRDAWHRPAWYDDAACRGNVDLFFPARGNYHKEQEARKVCHGCPVRFECLEEALDRGYSVGIWGGLSTKQRRSIRRQRRNNPPRGKMVVQAAPVLPWVEALTSTVTIRDKQERL